MPAKAVPALEGDSGRRRRRSWNGPRGRHWLALWLLFFLGVLAWVVGRQTAAVVLAARLAETRDRRSILEGQKVELLGRIRTASTRSVLIPRARALGLRLPADSEIIILQVPNPERQ